MFVKLSRIEGGEIWVNLNRVETVELSTEEPGSTLLSFRDDTSIAVVELPEFIAEQYNVLPVSYVSIDENPEVVGI